jgi:hypothetical protein
MSDINQEVEFEDLDFTPVEDSALDELVSLSESFDYSLDIDDVAFRRISAAKNLAFTTYLRDPKTKKETEIPEVPGGVVALRGVIVKARFGFQLYNSIAKSYVCNTTKAILPSGKTIQNSHPMIRAVWSPAVVPKDGQNENTPRPEVIAMSPIGRANGPCVSCIQAGKHIIKHEAKEGGDKPRIDYCGLSSSVLFCVMAFALPRVVYKDGAPYTSFQWFNVADYQDQFGAKPYSQPFIVNLSLSRFISTTRLGKRLQVRTSPYNDIPRDVQTLDSFLKQCHDAGLVKVARVKGEEELVYGTVVEVFASQPTEQYEKDVSDMVKCIPVFSAQTDPEITGGNEKISTWIKTAWQCYLTEKNAFANLGGFKPSIEGGQKVAAIAAPPAPTTTPPQKTEEPKTEPASPPPAPPAPPSDPKAPEASTAEVTTPQDSELSAAAALGAIFTIDP